MLPIFALLFICCTIAILIGFAVGYTDAQARKDARWLQASQRQLAERRDWRHIGAKKA